MTPSINAPWVRLIVAARDDDAVRAIFRAHGALEYTDADVRDPEPPGSLAGIAGCYLDFRGGAPSSLQPMGGPLADLVRAGIPAVGIYRDADRCEAWAIYDELPGPAGEHRRFYGSGWFRHSADVDGWPVVRVGWDGEPFDAWHLARFTRERDTALQVLDERNC